MRIAYDNIIDNASTILTESNFTPGYPVENVQDQRLSVQWVTSSTSAISVVIDFGLPKQVNTLAILGHNIEIGTVKSMGRLGTETYVTSFVNLGSGTVLAGTGATGQIYKSTDYASSWTNITRLSSETFILTLTSLGSGVILAGTQPLGRIYKSTDSGSSWSFIQRLGTETSIESAVHLGSGVVLVGTGATGQIYKSTDSGSSWTNIQRLSSATYIHALVDIGSGVVLAGTRPTGQVFRSTDSGSSWSFIQRLGTELDVESMVYLGSNIVVAGTSSTGQIYRSTDAGLTWTFIQRLDGETNILSMENIGNGIIIAGTYPLGRLYKSIDYGLTWSFIQRVGTETSLYMITSLATGIFLVGTSEGGLVYRSATEITIHGNATDSWGSPAITNVLVWNEDVILKYITSVAYRYWKIVIDNRSNSTDTLKIGRIWLGTYITIDPSSLLDFSVTKKRSDLITHGRNRQKWASIGVGWRLFKLSFPSSNETMIRIITDFIDAVGLHSSFIFCNFDTIRDYILVEPCYVSLVEDIAFSHNNGMKYEYSLLLEEEK
jgi:photosystem II stability/assembly factor-like uncharacterized protein